MGYLMIFFNFAYIEYISKYWTYVVIFTQPIVRLRKIFSATSSPQKLTK